MRSIDINREELAWAGGFHSGEGYTGLSKFSSIGKKSGKRKYWKKYPVISIAQALSPETLDRFNSAIGNLGKVYGPYGPYSTNKKSYYQLQISGFEKVQATIAMLWSFLSTAKQEQASNVLKMYKEQPKTAISNIEKTHCPKGHSYSGENLYIAKKSGYRQCNICRRETALENYHSNKNKKGK